MLASELIQAADACDAAANATSQQEEMRAMMSVFRHQEALQIGMIAARMNRLSSVPYAHERIPLRDDGDDIGRVESRIPKEMFFHLLKQKNFGWEGLTSDEGQRDIAKAHPAVRVKTISGKITSGYTGQNRRRVKSYPETSNIQHRTSNIESGKGN